MKKSCFYIWGILYFLTSGCNSDQKELSFYPPQFRDTIDIKGHVLNDSFIMGAAFDIDVYQNYLILQAFKGTGEGKLHFFDLSNGHYIKSILPKGRGPGEALCVIDFDVDQDSGEVLFYDTMLHKMYRFNVDSIILNENCKDYILSKIYSTYMLAIYQGKEGYIAKGGLKLKTGESPRFSMIENDSVIFRYCSYPEVYVPGVRDGITISYRKYAYIDVSPDKTKLVCVSGLGAILEIFDIQENKIVLDTIRGFYKPIFEVDKHESIIDIPKQTIYGFIDLYLTNQYIYAIFNTGYDDNNRKNFAVFNWNGDCIRLYRTDYDLNRICVDEGRNRLYAVGRDENLETLLVEFDLDVDISGN